MFSPLRRSLLATSLCLMLAGSGCRRPAADPVSVTQRFFSQIAAGQTHEAYTAAAFGFQAQETESIFAQTVRELGLKDYASSAWEAPRIEGREARLDGQVTNKSGVTRPFTVTLLLENGEWRIYALRSPRDEATGYRRNHFSLVGKGSGFADALNRPIPSDPELKALALETLLRFNAAIQVKSFDFFFENVSEAWKRQLSPSALQRAFQPFIDTEVNMVGIREVEAVLDERPSLSNDGLLTVTGHFPSRPYEVHFILRYVYELPRWRLFGCDVNLLRPKAP